MKWYIKVLKNYVNFNGRARRKEYWMFVLFNMIFCAVAMLLDNLIGTSFKRTFINPIDYSTMEVSLYYGWIYLIYALAVLLPGLAVAVRRLHDIGKSGWLILIGLIPIVGGIILIIWACTEGDHGDNQYGPDPKMVEE